MTNEQIAVLVFGGLLLIAIIIHALRGMRIK